MSCTLAVVALLAVVDRTGLFGRGSDDFATYHDKEFAVVRVVDGDTLDIDHPDATTRRRSTRVRLWGVDTPETVRPDTPVQHFGPEAGEFARHMLEGRRLRLRLLDDRPTRGRRGRLLAYVILPDGRVFNKLLVEQGYAYADPRFPHPFANEYAAAMAEARQAGRGLWAEAGQDDLPSYLNDREE